MKNQLYLSLGSNLGDKEDNIEKAIQLLRERTGKVISRSAFFYSEPWGFVSDNNFVNICLHIETILAPDEILYQTQLIEKELGRTKKSLNGYADRIIDIDLLLYDQLIIQTDTLTIPHPLMHKRDFVMVPLSEIAGNLIHPTLQKSISELTKLL